MTGAKSIVFAFASFRETAHSFELPVGMKSIFSSSEYFMTVCLMPHIPYQCIIRGVEHIMNGCGEFHHAQTGAEMPSFYRDNINDSWTTLGTWDFATYGAKSSYIFPAGIHKVENIQIKIELTTGASSKNTPFLQEVRLY